MDMASFFRSMVSLPGKVTNEFINPDSVMRSHLRGAGSTVVAAAVDAKETAFDSTIVARRELGDATVAVGSLVARLATSVSGALRDGEFTTEGGFVGAIAGTPGRVSASEAAAAASAAAAEEDEKSLVSAENEDEDENSLALGRVVCLPRFLRPAHGAVILFVGGGPIGLWTALQLKLLRPLWRIVVAERYTQYLRSHVLRISAQSFDRIVPHPEARAFVTRLLGGRAAVSVRTTELERALRTLAEGVGVEIVIGEAVRALPLGAPGGGAYLAIPSRPPPPLPLSALSSPPGVQAALAAAGGADVRRTICGIGHHSEKLEQILTSASVIVACDGARSLCRRLLFGSAGGTGLREMQSLAHMVHVRYEAAGTTSRLSTLAATAVFSAMGFVGEEHVGRQRGNPAVTPCTLTLVVNEDALGFLRGGGSGGGTYSLAVAPWAPRLRDAVRLWLNAKSDLVNETRIVGSETVTAVHLSVYRAEAFVTYASRIAATRKSTIAATDTIACSASPASPVVPAELDGAPSTALSVNASEQMQVFVPPTDCAFALVGDAAFGVPYYRSLNNGLICGSELAIALSEHGSASGNSWRCGDSSPPLESYARAVDRLATQELAAARLKAKAFALASSGVFATHALSSDQGLLSPVSLVFDAARVERWRQAPLQVAVAPLVVVPQQ